MVKSDDGAIVKMIPGEHGIVKRTRKYGYSVMSLLFR